MGNFQNTGSRPAGSTDLWLTESGVQFLATYRIWIVAAVWLGARGFVFWGLTPNFSIESFIKIAGDWLDGYTPYAAFEVAYPPGALLLFALPRLLTEAPIIYGYIFAWVILMADLAILLIIWRIPALAFRGDIKTELAGRCASTLLCLTYILFTAVFGRLVFQGYDLFIGLLLVGAVYSALRQKAVLVDVILAVGIWFNLSVVCWIPLLWWYGVFGFTLMAQ